MKPFILLSILYITVPSHAQDSLLYNIFPIANNKVIYERIIELPGHSKDSLFMKAKVWALSAFNSQKAAFQTEDREGGLLAYRTFFSNEFKPPTILGVTVNQTWQFWSGVRIYVKDGKAKIVVESEHVKMSNPANHQYDADYQLVTFKDTIHDAYKNTSSRYRERYWASALENFKIANTKYIALLGSIEKSLSSKSRSESDF